MGAFEAILLGVLQALTEFLPVSSSGHLVLAQAALGMKEAGLALDVSLHVGTLLAVVVVYRKAIRDLQTVSDSITVTEGGRVGAFELRVEIEHSYSGDLQIFLVHGGSELLVYDQEGGSRPDVKATWRIEAFEGFDKAGDWSLYIRDRARQDEGTLQAWGLDFE